MVRTSWWRHDTGSNLAVRLGTTNSLLPNQPSNCYYKGVHTLYPLVVCVYESWSLMKKGFPLVVVFIVVSLFVSACGSPPPLKSDKYLGDTSLVSGDASCAPPCFRGITVGKTTFSDAL